MRPPDAATKTVHLYGEELQRSYGGAREARVDLFC
jgi:hypothetical protein